MRSYAPGEPLAFDLALPAIALEAGARVDRHVVRGFHLGPTGDAQALGERAVRRNAVEPPRALRRTARELANLREDALRCAAPLDDAVPTVLVVHALTGDARAGGPGGFWEPVIGVGRALDPSRVRVLCFNLLGSCYGTSGPADEGFPSRADDRRMAKSSYIGPGRFDVPEALLPATVTTWDQARSILLALDALGVRRVALATGGSLGAMITLCLGALDPGRFERLAPFAGMEAASAWTIAFNHVGRQAILADPDFPRAPARGLALARQLAMISYRAEAGLDRTQGRRQATTDHPDAWSSRAPYRVQTYLENQGEKLVRRFDARAYLSLLDAMDHHDLSRAPPPPETCERWPEHLPVDGDPADSWGLGRIRASTLAIDIDTDVLYLPEQTRRTVERLRARGVTSERGTIASPHGHDAFLIEWPQVDELLRRALRLPAPR